MKRLFIIILQILFLSTPFIIYNFPNEWKYHYKGEVVSSTVRTDNKMNDEGKIHYHFNFRDSKTGSIVSSDYFCDECGKYYVDPEETWVIEQLNQGKVYEPFKCCHYYVPFIFSCLIDIFIIFQWIVFIFTGMNDADDCSGCPIKHLCPVYRYFPSETCRDFDITPLKTFYNYILPKFMWFWGY